MTGTIPVAEGPRLFRGWWVLAGVFLVMTTGSGFAFYAQGVFLDALVVEQGFSVGMAGAGTGVFFLVSGLAGYYAGSLISRFDIRAVIVGGATVAAIGLVLLGLVRTEWQMFAVFVIYGGGYAFTGLVPATSLVTRWFHVKRSVALSIASTGLSVGGIAITPVIAQLIDERSLVELAPTLAVGYWLGIVVPTLVLLRPSPESLGLRPDGAATLPAGSAPEVVPGVDFAVAVRTRFFRYFSAGFILIMGAQVGAIQHLFKLTKDVFDVNVASVALIVITSTSVAARLAGGVAATKFPIRSLANVLVLVQAVGIATIGLAEQQWMIFLGVVVLGMAMGNLLMLHPLILADSFGVRDYPRIYGLGSLLMVTGVGLGPFVVGVIRDAASYRAAYLTMAAVGLVGLGIVRLAGAPDKSWTRTANPGLEDTLAEAPVSGNGAGDPRSGPASRPVPAAVAVSAVPVSPVFAAITQDLPPAIVGQHDWNPDPAWSAPSRPQSGAGDTSDDSDTSNGGDTSDDSDTDLRFRRPPTILSVTPEPGHDEGQPLTPMPEPSTTTRSEQVIGRPPSVLEPSVIEPSVIEPAATEPAATEPAVTESAVTEPAADSGPSQADKAARFAVPMAIASTAVAIALMTWVRWLSRSEDPGSDGLPKQ